MELIKILNNKPLWTAFAAFLLAQFIKVIWGLVRERRIPWKRVFGSGGMPSSHSSGVCALVTVLGLHHGFDSSEFAISLTYASIVMYDASGIRNAAGKHAMILNHLIENLQEAIHEGIQHIELKTLLGHTNTQVFFGALLGVVVGVLSYYFI